MIYLYIPKNRDTNLDLLRSICALFVVFEHFCETSAHNVFGITLESSMLAHVFLRIIYGIARPAVPVFFLLSGYLSINSYKKKIGKPINLFVMTSTYSVICYVISIILKAIKGNAGFLIMDFVKALFPQQYFLYLFCALYMFSPFLNKSLVNLGQKNYFRLIIILFFIFSFWSTVINTFTAVTDNPDAVGWYFTSRTGTSRGFNIANFTMLYVIGGYIRLFYSAKPKRDITLSASILFCSTIITTIGKILFPTSSKALLYYDSIFVTIPAISLLILFLNINVKQNRIITFMGMHTFGTYLIHGSVSSCVEKIISIEKTVSTGIVGTLLGIGVFVVGVYVLSLIVTSCLEMLASPLNKKWKRTKLYNYQLFLLDKVEEH